MIEINIFDQTYVQSVYVTGLLIKYTKLLHSEDQTLELMVNLEKLY